MGACPALITAKCAQGFWAGAWAVCSTDVARLTCAGARSSLVAWAAASARLHGQGSTLEQAPFALLALRRGLSGELIMSAFVKLEVAGLCMWAHLHLSP